MEIKEYLTTCNYWQGNGANGKKDNKYIVVHYVGAVSSALNNAKYFHSVNRGASANYFVDENDIYRVVKDEDSAWHVGNKTYIHPYCRNINSIGVEMCCFNNNGVLDISDKVVERTIELVKELMIKYNIPIENVLRHYDVTGKNCPAPFVSNPIRWDNFKSKLVKSPLSYCGHIQNIGWTNYVNNSETCGTTGQALRLEAIKIDADIPIQAKAHIQDIGWVDYGTINKDTIIGTTGEAKRLEAICLKGDIMYRVHLQNDGWTNWTKADGIATLGSVGMSQRIEAIEIKKT